MIRLIFKRTLEQKQLLPLYVATLLLCLCFVRYFVRTLVCLLTYIYLPNRFTSTERNNWISFPSHG